MPAQPSVAVIIPNHTRVSELRDAIASVRAQRYAGAVRIYLVHEPRDELRPLLEEGDPDLVAIPHQTDPGAASIAARRNVGLAASTEDLVAFLDDDDLWHPDKLSRQVEALRSTGAIAAVTGFMNFPAGAHPRWPQHQARPLEILSLYKLARSGFFMTSSAVVDGQIARGLRLDERPEWIGVDDYDFRLRLANLGSSVLVPDVLTALRLHATSGSRARPNLHFARALDVFARWFADHRWSLSAWRALAVRLPVTAVFPGPGRDGDAEALLFEALDGRVLGPLDRILALAIKAAWHSKFVVPAVRKFVPTRLLQ